MRWAIWKAVRRWAKVPEGEILPKWLQILHAILFPIHHLILNGTSYGMGFDPERCVFIIFGMAYSEGLFRHLAYGDDRAFRVVKRENGLITIEEVKGLDKTCSNQLNLK